MVNTEPMATRQYRQSNYNILNIVVNTEQRKYSRPALVNYNILNIVVNTEQFSINDYFFPKL